VELSGSTDELGYAMTASVYSTMRMRQRVARVHLRQLTPVHVGCVRDSMCSDKVQLQFGRVGRNDFVLDYSHPFSGLLAFAVAVSAITSSAYCG